MAVIGKMFLTWDPHPRWSCRRTGSLSAGRSPPRRPRGSGSGPSRRRTQSPSFSSTSSSGSSRSCSGRCRRSRKLWKPWPEQISAFYLFINFQSSGKAFGVRKLGRNLLLILPVLQENGTFNGFQTFSGFLILWLNGEDGKREEKSRRFIQR